VLGARDGVAATVTPHHLLLNRNALFAGGSSPHHYCLPVLKGEAHRQALVEAVTSGSERFFLGTDSAPHPRSGKESASGRAGIFSATAAIELVAEVFSDAGQLDRLEGFTSLFGADFYGRPRPNQRITLVREPWQMPASFAFGDDEVVPLRAGGRIEWRIAEGGQTSDVRRET
jgi:dihydroorotase